MCVWQGREVYFFCFRVLQAFNFIVVQKTDIRRFHCIVNGKKRLSLGGGRGEMTCCDSGHFSVDPSRSCMKVPVILLESTVARWLEAAMQPNVMLQAEATACYG